jgi:2-phosphosulfolactate phosphatase
MALDADEILIGAFSNITTLTNYCNSKKKNVLILCSGWNNRFCLEDTLFAGALTEKLIKTGKFCSDSDATLAALELWKIAHPDLINYICSTEHYQRLKNNGLEDSVEYCLTNDTTPVLPVYDKINRIFILKK